MNRLEVEVVVGSVKDVKPYGAFDIGGLVVFTYLKLVMNTLKHITF